MSWSGLRFPDAGIVVRKESVFLSNLAISVSFKTDVKRRILVFPPYIFANAVGLQARWKVQLGAEWVHLS